MSINPLEMYHSTSVRNDYKPLAIPVSLLQEESKHAYCGIDLAEIQEAYHFYHYGAVFGTDGIIGISTNRKSETEILDAYSSSFTPANLPFKFAASLIDKQARFLFAEQPDIVIKDNNEQKAEKNAIDRLQAYVNAVLKYNNFEAGIIKAAKDCFIGKRVACMVDFSTNAGVVLTWIRSDKFVFEYSKSNPSRLEKFVYFQKHIVDGKDMFLRKRYVMTDTALLEEAIIDQTGTVVKITIPLYDTGLSQIPAVVIINDGLTGDIFGQSDIESIKHYEAWYSQLANGDMDSGRFNMNPIRVIMDASQKSTSRLKMRTGEVWDLISDPDSTNDKTVKVQMLESSANYTDALKQTLERIKSTAMDSMDIPNINLETMAGKITSGKALKAIYWSLLVRCKEKMKTWAPALRNIVNIMIEGGKIYPHTITQYTAFYLPNDLYDIDIIQNNAIPEDDEAEQAIDITNVQNGTMSRKAFMMKWRGLSEQQAENELLQIQKESQPIATTNGEEQ